MARSSGRDQTSAAMYEVSRRMSTKYGTTVVRSRRRRLTAITEGIAVPSIDVFEAVRWRRPFTRNWRNLQPVDRAAAKTGDRLRQST
jgi:hypothetical protein